ncbi:uncharacterized protein DEA37_0011170 [Paragonimus westermani]|uniref:Integrase catalytic domain-containing protein n=1 Tax=Paragonimus westermani TaxID=34504 RepID=A0A5J4N3K9_9TREM|nr:uncharacterized protein DEA37_0011170 [Paragonimus westermani]
MGLLSAARRGNLHILVPVDYFTKWSEVVPIERQVACTVTAAIINEWIARYGAPIMLHSDRGAAFEGHLFRETCRLPRIKETCITLIFHKGIDWWNGLI